MGKMLEVEPRAWLHDRRIAVSLTYDGALPEHIDVVGPTLQELGLRGTFFLSPTRTLENVQAWQSLSDQGHEMGNGCLLGVSEGGRLPNWTLRMVEQDIYMTQEFFGSIFPDSEPTSFAYPGRIPMCSQGSYRSVVNETFAQARSFVPGQNLAGGSAQFLKVHDVTTQTTDTLQTWKDGLLAQIENPPSRFVWHVLRFEKMFHDETNSALMAHEICASFLALHHESVWVAPVRAVAESFNRVSSLATFS